MIAALHALRHGLGLDIPSTQTTAAERTCLHRHASGVATAAEIGVFEGVSTRTIREAMAPDGVLHAVDPFFTGRLGICWGRVIAQREIARSSGAKVAFVETLSQAALSIVPDELDFIFIDADHSLEGITGDWEGWSRKVRRGGKILLHDTKVPAHDPSVATLGSVRYFDTVIRHDTRFLLLEQVDSLSVLQRVAPADP